ncbi:WAT1-related protein At4g30420 [Helianthus annuus]|uniref:WAT1-related protein n=1 Tax=Helianthus annuus TaxID=4232 RepID=A0A251TLZ0_HELAN|nr:WAT1-related protein At4g30420 [Helianthus annuus]
MGDIESYKPVIVMVVMQFTYGAVSITTRASLLEGMNPRVFVFYRQAIATLIVAPIAYFSRSKTTRCCIGWKSFWLIFIAGLIGITISQMIFLEGLYLASSSAGSAIFNLVPAITFVAASIIGYEPINIRSLRTMAKIFGTIVCVTSAAAMALIKGPKLLNANLPSSNSLLLNSTEFDNLWLLGCLCIFGSSCCWSFWLIIQVQVTKSYPDHLSLSAWMCFITTVQSGTIILFTDPHLEAWKVTSYFQMGSLLYAATAGSGISIFAQSWIVQKRGPVFSAMFNPLNTVIVTIFASIFLREQIYVGSVVGAVGIVIGLYVVLWGKAKDLEEMKEQQEKKMMISQKDQTDVVRIMVDEANMEEPLLPKQTNKL